MTFETTVPVRYRDLDPMGHVNNAVYATYFEAVRTAFFREVVGIELADSQAALASLSIDFRAPIEGTGTVRAVLDVTDVGTTSLTFGYELHYEDRLVAEGQTVQVAVGEDGPEPLPESVREAGERHLVE
ncbi:acyl-CoA thioesterase [Halobaculum magnesiiphilum]|uniref:Acyl-CoA thioesterase n=1 Tax=Halobaculum magnesiiphilum TaxID=1017351 RepID=A0A8T8WBE9_9EURY|nr:thioesterase family protein [Halobaculum magnesiiphilum]QZP37167.1 acyl-CoA thioesterase [Halobaculum magnesiiphilum]